MKTLFSSKMFLAITATLASAGFAGQKPPVGKFEVDGMHSKVGFEIPHLVISTVEGQFRSYQGQFTFGDSLKDAQLQAEVDVNTIDTGVADRDGHLKSPDFFDVAKHPKMVFKSKRFEAKGDQWRIVGDLTIHGVTREVTLDAKYLGAVVDAYGNQRVALTAGTQINRKDFGLTWGKVVEAGPVVGDKVTIALKLQAVKSQKQASK